VLLRKLRDEDRKPIATRHPDVAQDEGAVSPASRLEGVADKVDHERGSIRRLDDEVAVGAQEVRDQRPLGLVVVRHEDPELRPRWFSVFLVHA
jgi:hypothetical protein